MEIISRKEAIENNQQFFFTGVPCKNDHTSERRVDNYSCVQCARDQRKEIYYKDIDKSREEARARKIIAYKKNPDYFKDFERARRERDPDKYKEQQKIQYHKHAEKRKARVREYQKENST